jgi:hypothetical protein
MKCQPWLQCAGYCGCCSIMWSCKSAQTCEEKRAVLVVMTIFSSYPSLYGGKTLSKKFSNRFSLHFIDQRYFTWSFVSHKPHKLCHMTIFNVSYGHSRTASFCHPGLCSIAARDMFHIFSQVICYMATPGQYHSHLRTVSFCQPWTLLHGYSRVVLHHHVSAEGFCHILSNNCDTLSVGSGLWEAYENLT